MSKFIAMVAVVLFLPVAGIPAEKKLSAGKKIFIDKMPQDLDAYLKAEFVKQHVPLVVVGWTGPHF